MPTTVTTPIQFTTQSNFSFDNTLVTMGSTGVKLLVAAGVYPTSNPKVSMVNPLTMSSISSFVETSATYTAPDAIQYIINVAGTDYYWSGAAWTVSNGTYAQSNTASVANAHVAHASMNTLLTGGQKVLIKTFLHSNSGSSTPLLTTVSMTYVFVAIKPSDPSICVVYLWLKDILDIDIGSVQVAMFAAKNILGFKYNSFFVPPVNKSVSFDSNGKAEMAIVETQTPGVNMNFSVTYLIGKTTNQIDFAPCIVPNQGSVALTSITTQLKI